MRLDPINLIVYVVIKLGLLWGGKSPKIALNRGLNCQISLKSPEIA